MDYWQQHPDALNGQPKRTIGDYVESQGILVPRRFDTIAEAKRAGVPVLLRSEHPNEYNNLSGIFESKTWENESDQTIQEIQEQYIASLHETSGTPLHHRVCHYMQTQVSDFEKDFSFSIWHEMEGIQRVVIADTAIKQRYHVLSYQPTKGMNHSIVDGTSITNQFCEKYETNRTKEVLDSIQLYETVRNLDRFDPTNCPIMEMLFHQDNHYFLQYHKARPFEESTFTLDSTNLPNTYSPYLVRGATKKEGETHKITVYYGDDFDPVKSNYQDHGSLGLDDDPIWMESTLHKRKLQLVEASNADFQIRKMVVGHGSRSQFYKPKISALIEFGKLFDEKEIIKMYDQTEHSGPSSVNIHIVSDGKKAFITRV